MVILNSEPSRTPHKILHMVIVPISIQINGCVERIELWLWQKRLSNHKGNRTMPLNTISHQSNTHHTRLVLIKRHKSPRLIRPYKPGVANTVPRKLLDSLPSLSHRLSSGSSVLLQHISHT